MMTTSINILIKSAFDSPSSVQPRTDSSWVYPKLVRPLRDCLPPSIYFKEAVGRCITALHAFCCPSAVFWRIWTVIVNSIKGIIIGRALSDIVQKINKALLPSVAHHDPPSPVISVVGIAWVLASRKHGVIRALQGMPAESVRFCSLSREFPLQTPTAFGFPGYQVSFLNRPFCSAIASTEPAMKPPYFDRIGSVNHPSPKTFPNKFVRRRSANPLPLSGVASNETSRLSLCPPKSFVIIFGNWRWTPAAAFTKFIHDSIVSRLSNRRNQLTTAMAELVPSGGEMPEHVLRHIA
jgi:hypothetical protein